MKGRSDQSQSDSRGGKTPRAAPGRADGLLSTPGLGQEVEQQKAEPETGRRLKATVHPGSLIPGGSEDVGRLFRKETAAGATGEQRPPVVDREMNSTTQTRLAYEA